MGLWDALGFGRNPEAPLDAAAGPRSGSAAPPGQAAVPGRTWGPAIDTHACRGCGTCVDECPTGVFALGRSAEVARVARPERCEPDCQRCATYCPNEGIRFPGRPAGAR